MTQLLSLQKVDAEVARVQKKLDAIPIETKRRREVLTRLETELSTLGKGIQAAEKQLQDLELQVTALDSAIAKQEGYRDRAQNASTFEAAQHQIGYLKADKEKLQADQFKLMGRLDELQPELASCESRLREVQVEFSEYEHEAERLERELLAKRDEIVVKRDEFLGGVPEEHLLGYQSLLETREGQAVVVVEGEHCSGCYTRLTTNDMARLQGGSSVVTCSSCRRILFLEP
ncbi:MAG: zinc ribbon domain-containing protein [Planctomycetota bacterium]